MVPTVGWWETGGEREFFSDRYTVTTRMIAALRWAAMWAILTFHESLLCRATSRDRVPKSQVVLMTFEDLTWMGGWVRLDLLLQTTLMDEVCFPG